MGKKVDNVADSKTYNGSDFSKVPPKKQSVQKMSTMERWGNRMQSVALICFSLSVPALLVFFFVSKKSDVPSAFWGYLFYACATIGVVGGHIGYYLIRKGRATREAEADKQSAGKED